MHAVVMRIVLTLILLIVLDSLVSHDLVFDVLFLQSLNLPTFSLLDACFTDPALGPYCITEDVFDNSEVDCSNLKSCTCDSDCGPDEGPGNPFPSCGIVGLRRCSDATRPTTGVCLV